MKKIISLCFFALLVLSGKIYAQSNLTWIPTSFGKGAKVTQAKEAFTGFNNEKEVATFAQNVRNNPDVASCESLGKDASGNYVFDIKMKEAHGAKYYLNWAPKLGIAYVMVNGEKKTPRELLAEANKK
jgi:hypothetical protein